MEVKFVGFLDEYDEGKGFPSIKDAFEKGLDNSYFASKVLKHLEYGKIVFACMHYIQDWETDKLLVPHGYFTDGQWVWPSYFPYYLQNHKDYKIDAEFLEYLKQRDFKPVKKVDPEIIFNIDYIVIKKLGWKVDESQPVYVKPEYSLTEKITNKLKYLNWRELRFRWKYRKHL